MEKIKDIIKETAGGGGVQEDRQGDREQSH